MMAPRTKPQAKKPTAPKAEAPAATAAPRVSENTLTGIQLRRAVGLKLGYRIEERQAGEMGYRNPPATRYVLVKPDGSEVSNRGNEEEMRAWWEAPAWEMYAEQALSLFEGNTVTLAVGNISANGTGEFTATADGVSAEGERPSEALCRLFVEI